MLYDPKWERSRTADVNSIHSLIGWLEQQPSNKHYNYFRCGNCVLQQYYTAKGCENVRVDSETVTYDGEQKYLPALFDDIAAGKPTIWGLVTGLLHLPNHRWTFGAALERARKLRKFA